MDTYKCWSLFINGIGVVATIAVVILAVFGEKIRKWWNSPKLIIELDDSIINEDGAGNKAWYYLIRVVNMRPSSPATNVRVMLNNIYRKDPTGSWREQTFSGPLQVTWRWPGSTQQFHTIGPEQKCTFGCLPEDLSGFNLQLYLYPNNLAQTIQSGELTRLKFKAVSDIAESKPLIIEMAWDGTWVEGKAEMANHCKIEEAIIGE